MPNERFPLVLAIHGGGTNRKVEADPVKRRAHCKAIAAALTAGYAVLEAGGEAMDAAVAAVALMEDTPYFNSGKGAVPTRAGTYELEASIMLSQPPASHPHIPASRRGVALALLTRTKNPSKLARAMYLNPDLVPHAFMSGPQAEALAETLGEELVDDPQSYFYTERRWREHREALGLSIDEDTPFSGCSDDYDPKLPTLGTVGAVALDARGCIASVTSTGGKSNRISGRIGDTAIMGSGFWAEEWDDEAAPLVSNGAGSSTLEWLSSWVPNLGLGSDTKGSEDSRKTLTRKRAVGISGTGDGDYFIRQATASVIVNRMKMLGESVEAATKWAILDLVRLGGMGGAVCVDRDGNVTMPMKCFGMYRGVIREDDRVPKVAIFEEDEFEAVDE